jgi:hypothetical protein
MHHDPHRRLVNFLFGAKGHLLLLHHYTPFTHPSSFPVAIVVNAEINFFCS